MTIMPIRVHHAVLNLIRSWLPLAFGLTVMAGLIYVTVQQNYRQSANDPQIQLAEDIAAAVANGVKPADLTAGGNTDMAKSLATYLIVVDKTNKVLAANAELNGKTPTVPDGVLAGARQGTQERVTWQPANGVRSAIVAMAVPKGDGQVVVVGRSLREVEVRESQLTIMVLGSWIVAFFGSLAIVSFANLLKPKPEPTVVPPSVQT